MITSINAQMHLVEFNTLLTKNLWGNIGKEFLYPDIEYPISFTTNNISNGEYEKIFPSEIDNKITMPLWSLLFKQLSFY